MGGGGGRRRIAASVVALTLPAALVGAAFTHGDAPGATTRTLKIHQGGTFQLSSGDFDSVDPALAYLPSSWSVLNATCVHLMTYPDKRPPAGFRVVPEAAAREPKVSRDRRTYTFTIRRIRFSNGARVTAQSFRWAITRLLTPSMRSPAVDQGYVQDIVGAADVLSGKASKPSGVVARGNKLVIRLVEPVTDFAARLTMPFFCAVPANLPIDPEGVGAGPGSGPYYIAGYVRGRRITLKRNRFYGGTRPHHVDSFVINLQAQSEGDVIDRIMSGKADSGWASLASYLDRGKQLVRRYGINRSQYFVRPSFFLRGFYLNSTRPLFRNNARLRRAVNYAVNRTALLRERGPRAGFLTDQYLPPSMPGFQNRRIYPLTTPDLKKARALARGRLRSGKAVLYTAARGPAVTQAQILKQNLSKIGIDVEIKQWPAPVLFAKIETRGEPWDIAWYGWTPDYVDPANSLNTLFQGGSPRNYAFDSRRYNRLLERAAVLSGRARYRAYGALDVKLARDAAPFVAYAYDSTPTLVSKRVDPRCVVLRPELDLAAVCLKR